MRKYWNLPCINGGNCMTAEAIIQTAEIDPDKNYGGLDFDDSDKNHLPNIPAVCYTCGKHAPEGIEVKHTKSMGLRYNTQSGRPEPGDVYYQDYLNEDWYWSNHKGPHLFCMLPNGIDWNIDSRAGNCDMPCIICKVPYNKHNSSDHKYKEAEPNHRCWVRTGNADNGTLHVDKTGYTCSAGAGSIQAGDYHGFLHHGHLNICP